MAARKLGARAYTSRPHQEKGSAPPESVECSLTPELNLVVVNLTSCKMNSLSGEVDLLTYRLDESDQ
jgi:hypothetical protein